MYKRLLCVIVFLVTVCGNLIPQNNLKISNLDKVTVNQYPAIIVGQDTVLVFKLPTVYCFPPYKFKNKREEQYYWRLVRDVKKTLPLSKVVRQVMIEANDTLMRLPTKKARNEFMRKYEKELYKKYEPIFKRMTFRQGKLLIRLIDRECEASSFDLIKSYRGGFVAGFWQLFAKMFGADLKSDFGKNKDDEMIERIIILVEAGQL
ncbi:MAG: DUF4294 domain-containing protein [Paludibacteraceae bacterium]|nr:DUF4294 domain-containing protein [Paludibacteraceae bacterium]